ncbi:glycosyltransferase family 4 protein [Acuticoccus sediminis]|uniref:glycosyltransferase family 4 protein n=1 Tax=Acuticoccus sediminis TaxID=2184697 RepID=UPI001CFDC584|nr:glycosyltransferase family 4 protein [Acuticoccus sediminis]
MSVSETSRFALNIDVFSSSEVSGWVTDRNDPMHPPLTLQFVIDGVPTSVIRADVKRKDVEAAGLGPLQSGFYWKLTDNLREALAERDLPFEFFVRGSGEGSFERVARRVLESRSGVTDEIRSAVAPALDSAIALVAKSGARLEKMPVRGEPKRYPLQETMFAFQGASKGNVRQSLSPYLEFQHTRLKLYQGLPLDGSETARNRYLRWYLDNYVGMRPRFRIPLGADEIAYLNAPVPLVGNRYKLSQASLSYAMTTPGAAEVFPLTDIFQYEKFVRWWALEMAVELRAEDCLVPDYYVDVLRRVPNYFLGKEWALSRFIEEEHKANPRYQVLDLSTPDHRRLMHVWLLLEAIRHPGMIRFLPTKNLTALFDGPPRETLFDKTVQAMHPSGEAITEVFDAERYAKYLLGNAFDLKRLRFNTFDAQGNRFDAARFPAATTPREERIPLQIIGPLAKSSGLGQASRLSFETLKAAGYEPNVVDFDLDNPAPVGMNSKELAFDEPKPAKVNLIHLNGETLPMALAYLPDVYNGAYNIGYYFWELSRPSDAQLLSFELVDEIWVATEYGVTIYEPVMGDKPVRNVGMAVEEVADPGRDASRAWVRERLPVGPDTFVFLATFDSFSFVERKNPHGVVEAFQAAFGEDEDVFLVLKTHNRDFVDDPHQTMRWDRLLEIAATDPRITILNETLHYADLMKLKRGADCYVSLHRSEGWGFGLIEAMSIGVPILTTGYSGNMDFTLPEHSWIVDYDLVEPKANEYIFVDGDQVWAQPKLESAVEMMRAVRANPDERIRRAERAKAFVAKNFSIEAQARKYAKRLDEIFASLR